MAADETAGTASRSVDPPALLLLHREGVPEPHAAAYHTIEAGIARTCAELGCPHPYLALQTISGDPEVWFLNGFASAYQQEAVDRQYTANVRLMTALTEQSGRKAGLIKILGEHRASHRPERSRRNAWVLGRDRYVVVTIGDEAPLEGVSFEASDGTWFTLTGAPDAESALALSASGVPLVRALEVRPAWSCPALEWKRSNPELWIR
jgi:hypothetical protein